MLMIIDQNDLELDEDCRLYQGQPVTGTVRAFHPGGVMKRESPFVDGFEQGLCREWYSNGQLKTEWHAVRGVAEGKVCKWHENGQIKSVGNYLRGAELEYDEWNDAGVLVTHRVLDRQSGLWKYAHGLPL